MKQLVKSLSYILSISLIVFLLPINTNAATPTYNYEWVSQSGTISADGLAHEYTNLTAGQTINLSLTLYNRSGNTIQNRHKLGNSPDKQVPIGSWGIGSQTPHQDGTPHFLDTSSFVLNNNRFAYYEGNDVPNNSLITMNWNIKLANNLADGIYNLYVRPVSEYLAWTRQIKNGKLLPTTSSDIYWRFVVGEGGADVTSQGIYFMQGADGLYKLVNLDNGGTKAYFYINGNEIVSQHSYSNFPSYFILKQDKHLYSYNIRQNILNSIFGHDFLGNLNPGDNEIVSVSPSITEKDKFIIVINEIIETEGMFGYDIVDSRSYTFNASTNQAIFRSDLMEDSRSSCRKYDSKYDRFFVWPCGEGVGTSTPLSTYSLNGVHQHDIVTGDDFLSNSENVAGIHYNNGLFIAIKKHYLSGDDKIVVVNPNYYNPTKTHYILDRPIDTYIYSASISKDNDTIIIGGSDSILLLRYNYTGDIVEREYIPDAGIYNNFMFIYNNKAYYQPMLANVIRVINLDTWEIEKSLGSNNTEEVTLISFD